MSFEIINSNWRGELTFKVPESNWEYRLIKFIDTEKNTVSMKLIPLGPTDNHDAIERILGDKQ